MTKIVDGKGRGYEAEVDKYKRLVVTAHTQGNEETTAKSGDSYILHARCHLAAASSGGLLAFTNNDPDNQVHITRIYVDAHTLSDNIIITQIKDPATLIGGDDVSNTGIINKRFDSNKILDGTLLTSNATADLTYTGGTEYHSYVVGTLQSVSRDMRASNVVPNGKTILFGWEVVGGGNASNGEILSLSVNVFTVPKNGD